MLVRNRVLIYKSDHQYIGFRIFGQVINRVGNIADFGHSKGKGYGMHAAHPLSVFQGLITLRGGGGGEDIAKIMSCLKLKLEIYEMIFFSIVLAFKIL